MTFSLVVDCVMVMKRFVVQSPSLTEAGYLWKVSCGGGCKKLLFSKDVRTVSVQCQDMTWGFLIAISKSLIGGSSSSLLLQEPGWSSFGVLK